MTDRSDFGAKAPDESAWQMGKTAATIRFVGDAEAFLSRPDNGLDGTARAGLRAFVDRLRAGRAVLRNWLGVEAYLASPASYDPIPA